jgi:fructose/tagatose bisphosphate aldolase
MARVSFAQLMADAERGRYAVGYFESWSLESLLAVADAAEAARSPVILGFSGIYLSHPDRCARDRLAPYAAMAAAVAQALTVPACLLFNECPDRDWVEHAVDAGFDLVMFSSETVASRDRIATVRAIADRAHARGVAVEGETEPLAGVAGDLAAGATDADPRWTSAEEASAFVDGTGVDALAVNVGQLHLHGRRTAHLDLDRLRALAGLGVPLVLHGGSSVAVADLRAAIGLGVRKVNIGSRLKQVYFNALRDACASVSASANPYEVIGSGLEHDVLMRGRLAMQRAVEELMALFGSAGRAGQ